MPKVAPLNMNKVSSSLLSFGRKLMGPAVSGVSPINSEVHPSTSFAAAPAPVLQHPLAEPPPSSAPPPSHAQAQNYRLLKSESMPVHLSKGEQQTQRDRSGLVAGHASHSADPLTCFFIFTTIS